MCHLNMTATCLTLVVILCRPGNLRTSCKMLGVEWQGQAHSGLDDARNTAQLAAAMIKRGAVFTLTDSFIGLDSTGRKRQTTLADPNR